MAWVRVLHRSMRKSHAGSETDRNRRHNKDHARQELRLAELLDDKQIDVISILLPNHAHAEPTIAAAEAGKHVLVEKPPAMSLADTDQMIEACQQANVKLGIVLIPRPQADPGNPRGFGRRPIRPCRATAYMKWYRSPDDDWRWSGTGSGCDFIHTRSTTSICYST